LARERLAPKRPVLEHRDRLLALVGEFLDEALLADERSHRALHADLRQQACLERVGHRIAAVEASARCFLANVERAGVVASATVALQALKAAHAPLRSEQKAPKPAIA
jgi:hypothetical protein